MSNNSAIINEAKRYPEKAHLLHDRKAFEDAVRAMASGGLQFLIVGEPQAPDSPWIMQKQQRTVRRGQEDEIEILATYWISGDRITVVPSVADVLQSRLLSVTLALGNFFELAQQLDNYTPATGHSYLPPSYKPPKKAGPGAPSRATSPGADQSSQVPTGSQSVVGASSSTKSAESAFPDDLFLHSLRLTNQYGNEYADENPLLGEPGAFVFSSTTERVAAQNAAQAAAFQKSQDSQSAASETTNVTKTPGGSQLKSFDGENTSSTAAPTPKPPSAPGSRKGSVAKLPKTKEARRKSKATTTSPTSPTG
jgi:mediator of RNA polymerase II transcription subunit 6